ncbi:MAG: PEGA domain-containing protein [Opitutaceae bacterium]|nr:PEGA domain-containing protein [Opitutaceae bacterium]
MAVYDTLFPPGSSHRRYGPLILGGALLFLLLLGKCAFSSSDDGRRRIPDPAKTGRLVVKSNVAGATVSAEQLDARNPRDEGHGSGSVDQALSGLPPGRYALTLRAEGWPNTTGEATLEAGRTTELTVNFKSGSLHLTSDPEGATVRQRGTALGRTPLHLPHLPPGECELQLEIPGWPVASFKTVITAGGEATGNVRLPHGRLVVTSVPAGAAVVSGKRTLGQTPLTLERFPAGSGKLSLQAKDFPPLEVPIVLEDQGEAKIDTELGTAFPLLDPAALLQAVWVPDNPNRGAPTIDGVTGPFQPRNGIVRNLHRKRLYEGWLRKTYRYRAVVKSYNRTSGEIEFVEQQSDLAKYRVVAFLSAEARNHPEITARLVKDATFTFYGRLSAAEEARWVARVIQFEFTGVEPLRDGS